jgi:D-alanine transaminase
VAAGVGVITVPDIRWKRRDIKSVSLLPNILAKQEAVEAGAYEAWMVDDDGFITEGSSTNAWIVTKDGHLVTRDASTSILNGITRLSVLEVARRHGVTFQERPFSVEEALEAREAFLTSSSNFVMPVVRIDDRSVGNGHPGILTMRLHEGFRDYVRSLGNGG